MRAMILHEALVAARKPALVGMTIVSTTLLALFPLVWGVRGIPTLDGASLYDQLFRLEWILALVGLPWTAARVIAIDRADDLVSLSAATGMRPSRLLLARLLAATAALAAVVAGAIPAVVGAQQMAGTPLSRVIIDQLSLAAFALPAAVITVWWMQLSTNRLLGWLGAAATTLILAELTRLGAATMNQAAAAMTVVSVAAAAVLLERADVWWRYLSEQAS